MPVDTPHPLYSRILQLRKWEMVRRVIDNDAKNYLRQIENDPKRALAYKESAVLTNYTRLTLTGLVGMVMRKAPEMILPDSLEYMNKDANGMGLNLEQLSQQILSEVLCTGRHGILVDYPNNVDPGKGKSRLKTYDAYSIINWGYEQVDDEYKLTKLVLRESLEQFNEDGFEWISSIQFRVLRLENGVYTQEIYGEDNKPQPDSKFTPVDYNGNSFNAIPFFWVGSENNDWKIDLIPLYDIAVVNLGHYRNSADCEESSFVSGQAMLHIDLGESLNVDDFTTLNPDGVKFGSRTALITAGGGTASILQTGANPLPRQLMQDKSADIATIGARLITVNPGRETAEAARLRYSSSNSALHLVIKNVSTAIQNAAYVATQFQQEVPEDIFFELNTQLYDDEVDPQILMQTMLLTDRNIITASDVRNYLRRTSFLSPNRTDDMIDAEADQINPLVGADTLDSAD